MPFGWDIFFFLGRFAIRILLTYGLIVVQAERYDGAVSQVNTCLLGRQPFRLGIRVALGGSTLTPVSVYHRSLLRG